jgi:hypothetical protein
VPNDFGAMTEGVMSYERGEALPGVSATCAYATGSYGPVQADDPTRPSGYRRHASLAAALGRRGREVASILVP